MASVGKNDDHKYHLKVIVPKVVVYLFKVLQYRKYTQTNINKRPMGHIAHLRKQLKSINTYGYIITLI